MDNGNSLRAEFARDVRIGLCENSSKSLPAKYLYDDVGAALFQAITHLPEYGLARADERVLRHCAREIPMRMTAPDVMVAELGSGSGSKTRRILEAFAPGRVSHYCPIDISLQSLELCKRDLGRLVPVTPFHGPYIDGVRELRELRRTGTPVLLLFLGSSIGNFEPAERLSFLRSLKSHLLPGDHILFGFDLMRSPTRLLRAYDDPAGVTAAFNLNLLGRVNRELSGEFDLGSFRHVARYDEKQLRVEMHLLSECDQQVPIPGIGSTCRLRSGETIWTESSYKFRASDVRHELETAGFTRVDEWVDDGWPILEGMWSVRG